MQLLFKPLVHAHYPNANEPVNSIPGHWEPRLDNKAHLALSAA